MTRAVDIVRKLAPKAKKNYVEAFDKGDALLQQHEMTTPDRLAHFLAQVLHETGGLSLEWESLNYSAQRLCEVFGEGVHSACITIQEAQRLAGNQDAIGERVYGLGNPRKAQELGNTHPGDGFRYRGGGLMQTTGRANYRSMGALCGVNFEGAPELIVAPEHALKPALCEWSAAKLNSFADSNDILAISRAINIGNPRSKAKPNGLQDRVEWFAKVRPLIDRVEFETTGVAPPRALDGVEERAPVQNGLAALLGGRMLKRGDEDETVRTVQVALAKLGYSLQGTGFFGNATEAAIKDFQAKRGLEVDGVMGPNTAKAIDTAIERAEELAAGIIVDVPPLATPAVPKPLQERAPGPATAVAKPIAPLVGQKMLQIGDQSDTVRAVQLVLARLGYSLKATGYFGGATDTAVTHFQSTHGLEIDGVVGPETAKAIDDQAFGRGEQNKAQAPTVQEPNGKAVIDRPLWLIEALRWLDEKEAPGDDDNPHILEWAREEGGSIAQAFKHDSIPWCALFANMILTKTGFRGTETLWALDFANWGQKVTGPAVGAFVPMSRSGGGHIAVVVGRDQHGNLMCVGGNQDDAVNIKPFPRNRPVGYRWPNAASLPVNIGFESLPVVKSNGILSQSEA
jgi:uncharacterized protein (TIGR02594 family)